MMLATMAMLVVTMASSSLALSNLTDHIMSMSSNDFSGIPGMTGRPNLPTNTELLVTVMADEAWAKHEADDSMRAEPPLPGALVPPSSPAGQHTRAVASHSRDASTHAENRRALEEQLRRYGTTLLR